MKAPTEYTVSVYRFESYDEILPFIKQHGVVKTYIEGYPWRVTESVMTAGNLTIEPINWCGPRKVIEQFLRCDLRELIDLEHTAGIIYPRVSEEDSRFLFAGIVNNKEMKTDEQDN